MKASRAILAAVVAMVCLELLAYSQTLAFYGDEGFDLLAAQLILAGKQPYVDFFYQHTPLFTYLTAGWMTIFGQSWRSAHLLSALLTSGAIVMAAGFVYYRLPVAAPGWRATAAAATAVLIGAQKVILRFGTISQAYSACLFFSVGAFCLAVVAFERRRPVFTFGAGFCAGAAAASSLLALPVVPIVWLWCLWNSRPGERLALSVWFASGGLVPFLPVIWLLAASPSRVLFDIGGYHVFYRRQAWTMGQDVRVFLAWLESAQAVILGLLAFIGLFFAIGQSGWDSARRREIGLCATLAGGLALFAAVTRPTFEQYFTVAFPFAAILAAIGVVAIGSRLLPETGRPLVALFAAGVMMVPAAKSVYWFWTSTDFDWRRLDAIANTINEVTPAHGLLYANQLVYAAAGRIPPEGLENTSAPLMSLPSDHAAALHVASRNQIDGWVRAGRFDTVCNCDGTKAAEELGLEHLYRQHVRLRYVGTYPQYCDIYWDRTTP